MSVLLLYLAIAIFALMLLPLSAFAVLAFLALGATIVRSSLVHRREGWMSGLLFGVMLLLPPVGALVYWVLTGVFG